MPVLNPRELLDQLMSFRSEPGLFPEEPCRTQTLEFGGTEVPRIQRELWPARQRQGHSLHELSYRACFKAELPAFFLERLSGEGDPVLDPFMGRGTTLLEAALMGRVPLGNDASPLSRILIRPRLAPPELGEVRDRLAFLKREIRDPGPSGSDPDLSSFYEPGTLGRIRGLRRWFLSREASGEEDGLDGWLRMVATNRLTGHSPGFFSVRTMPPNQAVSIGVQKKLNERAGLVPPPRDVFAILEKKSRSLLRDLKPRERDRLHGIAPKSLLLTGDARDLSEVETASIQCTVTSPPFLNVVDYARDNWLRCWFNGLDAGSIARDLTVCKRLEDWCGTMEGVFAELHRVTRPGGWVVFEVGEVRGGFLLLEEPVLPLALGAGFEPVCVVVHSQDFTKTANCWGVENNRKGTNTQRLVLLQKPPSGGKGGG